MPFSISGGLQKLKSLYAKPVHYSLPIGEEEFLLNACLGKTFTLKFLGKMSCTYCGIAIKKSYSQGYCFPCSQKLARCDFCIVKPEKCHYHLGTCREPEWGLKHCFIPHIVYLANTSGFKVGITRETQIPTRWIDQGAIQALPLFRVQNRYQAGLVEVALKSFISDKTDWRKMLGSEGILLDLLEKRDELVNSLLLSANPPEILTEETITAIQYPVLEYPTKVKALSFEKTLKITGTLLGIKGQYLILDVGVINIRNLTGYLMEIISISTCC